MTFFRLRPEVAGGWGPNTSFTRVPGCPTTVHKLHYVFDGWLGDELLESTPCFIVTRRLADQIVEARLTGCECRHLEVSVSEECREFPSALELPEFVWLHIDGIAGVDDFGITHDYHLVVSERALGVIKSRQLEHCDVSECHHEGPPEKG